MKGSPVLPAIRWKPVEFSGRPVFSLGSIRDARPARAPQVGADKDDRNPGLENAPTKNKSFLNGCKKSGTDHSRSS